MMPQNTTEWAPSPKQAAVLEAAQEAGLGRSISAICEAARVDRTSFYRWLRKDPQFTAAWKDVWRGALNRHLPGVVAAMLEKAQQGDVPAARLVADLAGLLATRMDAKVQHTGKMEVETNRNNADDLQRILERMPRDAQNAFIDALWAVEDKANTTTAGDA